MSSFIMQMIIYMIIGTVTFTYVYSKNPVVAADVTVRYVDIENNPISEDIILQGNIGEKYSMIIRYDEILFIKNWEELTLSQVFRVTNVEF